MRMFDVVRDDRLRMPRIVAVDVCDGFSQITHDLDGEDEIAVLRRPILLLRLLERSADGTRLFTATQLDARRFHRPHEARQKFLSDTFVHKQRLHRIADRRARNLRIQSDLLRHGKIGALVDEGVADAASRLNDRHRAVLHHSADKSRTAARNHDIQEAVEVQHRLDPLPVGRVDEADRTRRHSRLLRRLREKRRDRRIRANRVCAAAQQHGVARLQAKPSRI